VVECPFVEGYIFTMNMDAAMDEMLLEEV